MSQNQIVITSGVTTHENVLDGMNSNFSDAETRTSSLEDKTLQQSISSSAGSLAFDTSLGGNATTTLTEDVTTFSITNAASGDSGLILFEQDNTAGWTFTSTYDVLAGDLADIASITASGIGAASVGWYHDGTDNYLYVSQAT